MPMTGPAVAFIVGLVLSGFYVSVMKSCETPAAAGESAAPMTCQIGTEEEFTELAGDEYQQLDRVAIDRLITFLAWTGRPSAQAERAWQWRDGEHVVVIFANSPCIVGYVTMDEPTFTAVIEAKPLPKPPPLQATPSAWQSA